MVELSEPRGFGPCRMQILTDASAALLKAFIAANVEDGAHVITDGWSGYRGIGTLGYTHEPRSQRAAQTRGEDTGTLLPAAHRVASLAKRWLLGTHQGAIADAHLQSCLDEFAFRFTFGAPAPVACSSIASSSSRSTMLRCATAIWSPIRELSPCRLRRRVEAAARRAWTVPAQTAHGAIASDIGPVI